MRALAPLVPRQVSAGVGNLKVVAFSGLQRRRQHWVHMDILEGSYGGRLGKDGLDAVDTLYANTRNNPIEDIESHFPLRVTRYELTRRPARRGALARRPRLDPRVRVPRARRHLARGRRLGAPAARPVRRRGRDARTRRDQPRGTNGVEVPSKFPYRATQAGDRLYLVAPSGGGYGPAAERDPDAIREDVADEVLSRERARELYGFEE